MPWKTVTCGKKHCRSEYFAIQFEIRAMSSPEVWSDAIEKKHEQHFTANTRP
jgi:hypothetical protein